MSQILRRQIVLPVIGILMTILLLVQVPTSSYAASPVEGDDGPLSMPDGGHSVSLLLEDVAPAAPGAPNACPAGPADLPEEIERDKFCVYYTTDSISHAEAEWAADIVEDYWDRFTDLGFNEPKYSGKLEVQLLDITGDCNGGTGWSANYITTYAGCFDISDEMAQATLGHELTHRVQYNHDTSASAPIQTKFLKEGTARASEDNWFTNIDHRPDALTAPFSFNLQVNEYFASANNDITSYGMRYNSCLWWKYASEQHGTPTTEPERGVDFFREVYDQNTAGHSGVAAVNQAFSAMGAGTNFHESFKKFAVANWAKDLTGVPDGSYNYIDEDETSSPAPYGPLSPADGGTINTTTDASWSSQFVSKYGLRYYKADIGASCPLVSASFHRNGSGPAFYHVVTQNGDIFNTHVEGSGADWTQAFLNDGISQITAIVGSLDDSSQVDVTLECAEPVVDIVMPNDGAVAYVTPADHFLAQVLVTNGSPTGPVVSGLGHSDFSAAVDGTDATVVNGGFIQEQYWLVIQAPTLSDGTYDLEVTLEIDGSSASDTNADSVIYDEDKTDQVLVLDRSGSMGVDDGVKLEAAQDAANFYVDVTRDEDGLAVVPYNQDVNPAPFDLEVVTGTVRDDAKTFINGLTASGMTSIGDGMKEAVSQRDGSETGNPRCSFVLLSDGMENTALYWADVMTDVKDSGCPVTTIAFGPESDETLMQEIATETGGTFFYNDVYVSSQASPLASATPGEMTLALDDVYEYAQARGEGRQRLLWEKGLLSRKVTSATHKVLVDDTLSEVVFALDWYEQYWAELELKLRKPDGSLIDHQKVLSYTFEDYESDHVGWRIPKPDPGPWEMIVELINIEEDAVPYQVLASGHTAVTLNLLLPDRLGSRYFTGNRVPIYAFFSGEKPIPGAEVEAWITAPDGTETHLWLFDDGEHGDGQADDGFYAGLYTLVNQAQPVSPSGEEGQTIPNDEGGYRVRARATHEERGLQREAMGGFSVLEGDDLNKNRLPDTFEEEYGVTEAEGDPDNDGLTNYQEYQNGTDPTDPDTDDGGENDGSEVSHDRNPLDPGDDLIEKPDYFEVLPWYKGVIRLFYDFKPTYSTMFFRRLYLGPMARSDAPLSVQQVITGELPAGGVYTDTTALSGAPYSYQIWAKGEGGEESAMFSSGVVTPTDDPVAPEALLLIDGGASSTEDLTVTLSLIPFEQEGEDTESFDDIAWALLSNEPSFAGASWQSVDDPATYTTTWTLEAAPGEVARVYARFRDDADNESVGTKMAMILYEANRVYLPLVLRQTP